MDGIFNLYKPAGFTSNDAVAMMRKILNMKKVGHGGTLDPDATGVLPVFTGTATRLLEFAVEGKKEYVAEFRLGIKTSTGDISGDIVATKSVPDFSQEDLEKVLTKFLGRQKQIPPMYSAIKIGGEKLYQLARRGEEVEREARDIEIYALEILGFNLPDLRLRVECSKGTYIRTLGEDIAVALGTVGTMAKLVRTKVGKFNLSESHTLEEIRENPNSCVLEPVNVIDLPKIILTPNQAWRITSGVPTTVRGTENGRCLALSPENELLAVVNINEEIVKAEKVLKKYANPNQN